MRRDDVDMEFFRARGPGGQRRNRRDTGVRLHHRPTGIIVEADDTASQAQNRELAFERLAERIGALSKKPKPRVATEPTKSAKEERMKEKKMRSAAKRLRREPAL